MPESYIQELVNTFSLIESTDMHWPQQLRFGTIIGAAKRKDVHEQSRFRPITLFSMLFRCWSKLGTRHLLTQLTQCMPAEALGFLPHREAAEIRLLLQGQIKVMLASRKQVFPS